MSRTPLEGILPAVPAAASAQDQLLSRCLKGEEGAFDAVYKEYAAVIYRLCFSLLQHREDAEEVLQDTFQYAFRKIENYDPGRASFKTWLYQIAVSRCRNMRRRKWLETLPLNNLFGSQLEDEKTPTPSEAMALTEIQQSVWNALGRLSPKLRETAVLRYYEGYTYVEIGRILSIPAKTAESRMRLAHKALRELLSEEFNESVI